MPKTYYAPLFECVECGTTFTKEHPESGTMTRWSPMRRVYEERPCLHQGKDPVLGPLGYGDSVSGWAVWTNKKHLRHAHIDKDGCLVMDEPVQQGDPVAVR